MRPESSLRRAIFLAALLPGCAATPDNAGGQGPSTADLAKLSMGRTTADEVKAILGQPVRSSRFDRLQRDVWEYRRYEDPFNEYHVAVQFSPDGVVREVLVLKDYNREPCGP
jgi:outer membrane protein assembly factor BamE (lipoprotein component of BamABCDE complex)